jgi:hypothetical protein
MTEQRGLLRTDLGAAEPGIVRDHRSMTLESHRMTSGHWKRRIFLTMTAHGRFSSSSSSKSPVSDR